MKKYTFFFCTLLISVAQGQTGPGGVGDMSNNKLWLAADKGVSLTGINVSSWADQSGNGNAALPFTPVNQPAFVASSVNGYPSLDFDGVNDELRVADNAGLDVTSWHIFMVVIVDAHKNYNAWLTKGNDGQENFELLSYNDGNIHTPTYYTDATRTFPSAAAGQVTTTEFNIVEYSYAPTVGRDVYKNSVAAVITDNENKIPSNNNFEIYIGNERGTARYLDGDIAEVIIYNTRLNSAQRIIVNNYLAAKYNKILSNNDVYDEDGTGYDHDVAGIGRIDATNFQSDSRGAGIVRMLNPSGLGDSEFLMWGHDNGVLSAINTTDVPAGVQARSNRVWRVSERNSTNSAAVNVGNTDIQFDLSGLGAITASDLRLLIDTDNDGLFSDETPISGATLVSGNVYQFAAVSGTALADNRRFTFATINSTQTPLPIELLSFVAEYVGENVKLRWETSSEHNNDYFTIERSADGTIFFDIGTVDGAGNSSVNQNYQFIDHDPYKAITYYRLKQTDFDGTFSRSQIIALEKVDPNTFDFMIYPNPSNGELLQIEMVGNEGKMTQLEVFDVLGKKCLSTHFVINNGSVFLLPNTDYYPNGLYFIKATCSGTMISKKMVVNRK